MRRSSAVVLTVLALAGAAGCSGAAPVQDQLVGTWVTNLKGIYVAFDGDGTYGKGYSPEQAAGTFQEAEWGTWTVEDGVLTLATAQGTLWCSGTTGTYEVEITDSGDQVLATLIADACEKRIADFPSGLTRHAETEP